MDRCKKITMGSFVLSLIKQLPLPLLMGLSLALGAGFVWMLCQVSVWFFVGLVVCALVFLFAILNSAKDQS